MVSGGSTSTGVSVTLCARRQGPKKSDDDGWDVKESKGGVLVQGRAGVMGDRRASSRAVQWISQAWSPRGNEGRTLQLHVPSLRASELIAFTRSIRTYLVLLVRVVAEIAQLVAVVPIIV